jgi:hypothetical protein
MNEWRVIFATVVIFGTGVITGGLLVNYVAHTFPNHPGSNHHTISASGTNGVNEAGGGNTNNSGPVIHVSEILNKPAFLPNLETRLATEKVPLSPAQLHSIEQAIGQGQADMRRLVQNVNRQIRQELTPDQLRKYDELLKNRSNLFHRAFPGKGDGLKSTNTAPPCLTNPPAKIAPASATTNGLAI